MQLARKLMTTVIAAALMTALASPSAQAVKGNGISGNASEAGHAVVWSTSGAYAFPASMADMAASYDAYTYLGQTVVVRGELSAAAVSSNRRFILSAQIVGGGINGWSWPFPSQSAGKSVTQTAGLSTQFELTVPVPASATTTDPNQQYVADINVMLRSDDCDPVNWSGCVGVHDRHFTIAVLRSPPKQPATGNAPVVNLPQFTKIITAGDKRRSFPGTTPFPVRIPYSVTNPGGRVKVHARLFSDGNVVAKYDSGMLKPGRFDYVMKRQPPGKGPYFICIYAEDAKGNRGAGPACTWLSIVVPAKLWSNGCGSDGVASGWWGQAALWVQNFTGNKRMYGKGVHRVDVEIACNIHDASYAGVTIFDPIARKYIDFRTWSRLSIDQKFKSDIQRQCRLSLTLPAEKPWLPTCLEGFTLDQAKQFMLVTAPTEGPLGAWALLQDKVGAQLYLDLVRTEGSVGFDADLVTPGTQPATPVSTNPAGGNRQSA